MYDMDRKNNVLCRYFKRILPSEQFTEYIDTIFTAKEKQPSQYHHRRRKE